jgi:hypothetical protein
MINAKVHFSDEDRQVLTCRISKTDPTGYGDFTHFVILRGKVSIDTFMDDAKITRNELTKLCNGWIADCLLPMDYLDCYSWIDIVRFYDRA